MLYLACIVFSIFCIYLVLQLPCTVFTRYCIYHVLYLTVTNSLDVFQTRCLRRILRIVWPNTISNKDLYRRTTTIPISEEIQKGRWRWIGHICRMQPDSFPRVALSWNSAGEKPRSRPRETLRRSTSRETTAKGWSWGQVERWAADREHWRTLVMALRANQPEQD